MVFPTIVLGQGLTDTPLGDIFVTINEIVGAVTWMLMSIATAVFLWGMVKYVMAGGDEKAKEASKGYIKAGIIGLFLMVAIWGIVSVIARTFDVDTEGIPAGPGYQQPSDRTTE